MRFNGEVYNKIYHPTPDVQTANGGGGLVKPEPKKEAKQAEEKQKPAEQSEIKEKETAEAAEIESGTGEEIEESNEVTD